MRRVLLISVVALLVAGVARAQGPGKPSDPEWDAKTHNGNACHPREGSEVADFRWFVRGIGNISSGHREISCPVVRDDYYGVTDVDLFYLVLRVPENALFCCTFYSFDEFGDDIIDEYEYCPEVSPQYRIVRAYLNSDVNNVVGGHYGLYCDVPPGGWVISYGIWEWGTTEGVPGTN